MALLTLAVPDATLAQTPSTAADPEPARRLAAFRAFATPLLGEWTCLVEDFGQGAPTPGWTDRQRRVFTFTMSRHFLEERAILARPDGTEYEGGVHLTTWNPNGDEIVQHGFWLPRQPDPLFRIEGRIAGAGFIGEMRIREEDGSERRSPLIMRWTGPDSWLLEVTGANPDGSVYLRERLTYNRVVPAGGPS